MSAAWEKIKMNAFFDWLDAFLVSGSVWVYVLIFVGKIFEVSMATLRIVLINRGEKLKGSLVAVVEISLWLLLVSSVLDGWRDDIFKFLTYVLAYACGSYIGTCLDEFLAFGLSSLQIVVSSPDECKRLAEHLQTQGYGVTSLRAQGKDANDRYMLMMVIKRKNLKYLLGDIKNICPGAMVTVSDVKTVRGGYMRSAGRRRSGAAR